MSQNEFLLNTSEVPSVPLPSAEIEYWNQVSAMERLIPHAEQEKFREKHILIAGCGSIGSPIAMALFREGADNLTLVDPETVDENNLARQEYSGWQVGDRKAQALALNLRLIRAVPPTKKIAEETVQEVIQPMFQQLQSAVQAPEFRIVDASTNTKGIRSVKEGITIENVDKYVMEADIIVDGIDIRALDMMYALHKKAAELKKPVVVGYDMAGTAMIAIYRYDLKDMKPLDGDFTEENLATFIKVKDAYSKSQITEAQFLQYVYSALNGPVDPLTVPVEQLKELLTRTGTEKTPQLGSTARSLSAMAVVVIRRIANGQETKSRILVDNPTLVRKSQPNVLERLGLLLKVKKKLDTDGKEIKAMVSNLSA